MSEKTSDNSDSPIILDENITVKDFCCGDKRYDDFIITKEALEHRQEKLGITYLFYQQNKCVGYVTISTGDLNREKHTKLKGMTKHENIPGVFLAQMATDKRYQKRGLGSYLVRWVIGYAYELSKNIGCRIVFLECEDGLKHFYESNGFELIPRRPKDSRNVMFIDLAGITV